MEQAISQVRWQCLDRIVMFCAPGMARCFNQMRRVSGRLANASATAEQIQCSG